MINVPLNCNWLQEQAKISGNNIAITSDEIVLTYSELHEKVVQRSKELSSIGIGKKSIIGKVADHDIQFIIDMFAVWNAGSSFFPMNSKIHPNEINEQANFIGCRILNEPNPNTLSGSNYFLEKSYAEKNIALIMFTSGSTGQHKAVQHTFKSLYANATSLDTKINFAQNDKWLASLPFYRIGGFQIVIRSLLSGGNLCIPTAVSTDDVNNAISKYSPQYISLVNSSLKEVINNDDLKSAKAIFVGGGPIESDLLQSGVDKQLHLYKVYGSTETGAMVSILDATNEPKKLDSAGKALGGVEVRIENDEVLIKADSLFSGYYRNQEFTTERLTDGWFYTGDEGYLDDDGYLFIKGRIDNLIISGGEKINPLEVETELKKIDGIENASVFGLFDEKWGEKVCAAIISENKINPTQIKKQLKENLAAYKIPKEIKVVEKLPLDEMGKVNLAKLERLFEQASA